MGTVDAVRSTSPTATRSATTWRTPPASTASIRTSTSAPRCTPRTGIRPPTPGPCTSPRTASPKTYRSRFVFFGSGYYNYDEPYTPDFPGIENFAGTVVHPQHWPEDLDYTGKTDRRHRLRRHRRLAGARAGPQGREGHHASALTGLSVLHAAGQPYLQRAAHGDAEQGLLHHHSHYRPGLREGAVGDRPPLPERGARIRPLAEREPAAQGLSGGRRLQAELQPVGRAHVPGRRWRRLRGDQQGPPRGGHRSHRPLRRRAASSASPASTSTPTSSSPPPDCNCRPSAGCGSAWTAPKSSRRTGSPTRRTCSTTFRTCSGASATPTPRGRCGPT